MKDEEKHINQDDQEALGKMMEEIEKSLKQKKAQNQVLRKIMDEIDQKQNSNHTNH